MFRVTVASRDMVLLDGLTESLQTAGMEVVRFGDGIEDQEPDPAAAPDVLLLDFRDQSGPARSLLQDAWSSALVIGLVAPSQLSAIDPSVGLDDFMIEPVNPRECVARVEQALWRHGRSVMRNTIAAGDLLVDLANYQVFESGRPVTLTYKEYELLRFLMTHAGNVFTREQLLNRVWGYNYYGGSRTVDVHVRRLRSKLEPGSSQYIETVRNVGYRFSKSVR